MCLSHGTCTGQRTTCKVISFFPPCGPEGASIFYPQSPLTGPYYLFSLSQHHHKENTGRIPIVYTEDLQLREM